MNFDAVEVYFIGRGRWWRSVDGADYRQFERFASDEDHYRESRHSRKMMLFMPVSESRRVKGVFSLTADDAGFAKHGEKCPSNLYVLMPSSSEDSVYLNDVRYNRIPDRGDLFFEVEHLESCDIAEHVPFPFKGDPNLEQAQLETPGTEEWNKLDARKAIDFIKGMALVHKFELGKTQSAEEFADWIIGEMPKIQGDYQLRINRQSVINILLEPLDNVRADYSVEELRTVMLAFAACLFEYRYPGDGKRDPLTGPAYLKKSGAVNKRSIAGQIAAISVAVSHDFIRKHLKIAHERFKTDAKSGIDCHR
ncbi:hypothetical protein [Methylotuvimicrobium sp. KM2]|uniref:hypothetical protein n=1 Tax=Methylotuvimicrobium sp. KM2 TaxID=3133976 RepID=UPI0031019EBD